MSRRFPRLKNTKSIDVRGYHDTLDNSGFELVTTTGPAIPTLPTAGGTLTIVSTDAGDTGKLVVDYLDAVSWQELRTVYTLNGTTPVTVDDNSATISAIRINRARYHGANIGRIDAKVGATTLQQIPAGAGASATAIYTVPVGQQAVIHGVYLTATEKTTVRLLQHLHGEGQAFQVLRTFNVQGSIYVPWGYPHRIETQGVDDTRHETKITLLADANCRTAAVTSFVEIGLDIEVSRNDTTSPGFLYT